VSVSGEVIRGLRRAMYRGTAGLFNPQVLVDTVGNPLNVTSEFDLQESLKATPDQIGTVVTTVFSPTATPTVIKATSGQIFSCVYLNLTGQAITFLHVFLKTAAPTVGTTMPDIFGVTSATFQQLIAGIPSTGIKAPSGIRVALSNNINSAVSTPAGGLICVTWK
jgi:hypothetical protein